MKTNQKLNANRTRSSMNGNRRPLNRAQQTGAQTRSAGSSSVKSRIGMPGINRSGGVVKPKGDLRQMLTKKVNSPAATNSSTTNATSSNVKSRLGLQSRTAILEANKQARAQFKAVQEKKAPVKSVKSQNTQIKKPTVLSTIAANRPAPRAQVTRKSLATAPIRQDRDRLLKDRNLSSRRPLERASLRSDFRSRNDRGPGVIKSVTTQPIIIQTPQYIPTSQPLFYTQPSHHHSSYDNAPNRYISRGSEVNAASDSLSPIGNSVLVSNLSPKITEDEVAELFGDIGPLMNLQIINSTTALITYFAAQHAHKAVKVYNYRLLDGIAMNCTILPQTTPATQQQSSQPLYSGRMYSDSIPAASRSTMRQNYHLGL